MKVARLHGIGDIRVGDEPEPEVGPGHSLVRVTAVGLCGSDLHWFGEGGIGDATLAHPLVLGHEFAGVVESGPLTGRRVAVDPAMPCRVCELCRDGNPNLCPDVAFAGHGSTDGGLRERLAWPDHLLHPLPDTISDAGGAVLEPLGVAIHSFDLGHVRVGASVAVVGCGPIGLLLVQLARTARASRVIAVEPLAHRRAAALAMGADLALTPEEAHDQSHDKAHGRAYDRAHDRAQDKAHDKAQGRAHGGGGLIEATAGRGVDVAFEVAGTDDAVHLAMVAARPGARVVLAGIPDADTTSFPASLARRKGLTLMLVRRMRDVYPRAIALVQRGAVDVESLVTDRFPIAHTPAAFASAAARGQLKTIIDISRHRCSLM